MIYISIIFGLFICPVFGFLRGIEGGGPTCALDDDKMKDSVLRFPWYKPTVVDGFIIGDEIITDVAYHLHETSQFLFHNRSKILTSGYFSSIDVERVISFINVILRKAHDEYWFPQEPFDKTHQHIQLYAVSEHLLTIWICNNNDSIPFDIKPQNYIIGSEWNHANVSTYLSKRHRYPPDPDLIFDMFWHSFHYVFKESLKTSPVIVSGYTIERQMLE